MIKKKFKAYLYPNNQPEINLGVHEAVSKIALLDELSKKHKVKVKALFVAEIK